MSVESARALLEVMEAPAELQAWVAELPRDDLEEAWAACTDPRWLLWLAGAGALSLTDGAQGLMTLAQQAAARLGDVPPVLAQVLAAAEEALARRGREDLVELAGAAEAAAAAPPATFRNASASALPGALRAAAWLARAADGLLAARLRAEAARLRAAQQTASYLGAGVDVLAQPEPVPRLMAERIARDPVQADLLYVVAALGEAADSLSEAGAAVALAEEDEVSPERARASLVSALREAFPEVARAS